MRLAIKIFQWLTAWNTYLNLAMCTTTVNHILTQKIHVKNRSLQGYKRVVVVWFISAIFFFNKNHRSVSHKNSTIVIAVVSEIFWGILIFSIKWCIEKILIACALTIVHSNNQIYDWCGATVVECVILVIIFAGTTCIISISILWWKWVCFDLVQYYWKY